MDALTRWTGDRVRDRLVEALKVELRLPGSNVAASMGRSWPATPLHEFHDVLHWTDARERIWENWSRAKGAYPHEVSLMEETYGWLGWVTEGERRCLQAWTVCVCRNLSVRRMLHSRGWSRATFYRKCEYGADRIAARLNSQGVAVR